MTRLLVGGTDQVQLPADSTGKRAGFVKTSIGGVGTEIYLPVSALVDDAGNTIDSAIASLAATGTERGIVTRPAGIVNVRGAAVPIQTLAVTAATPVTGAGLDVSAAGNCTFTVKNTVAATAFTGAPVIVFEQSDDNVSWGPLGVTRTDTGLTASTHTMPAGTANGSIMLDAGLEGVNWVRVRVTTAQTANGMTITTTPGGLAFSPSVSLTGVTVKAASATVAATDQQLAVGLHPNSNPAKIWDGSVAVTFKAASVPAAVTDTAMVVAVASWQTTKVLAAASTNAGFSKASAGLVGGWHIFNAAAATRYIRLFDKASAPTVGTDSPKMVIPIPAGAAANVEITAGVVFSTGIAYAITAAIADLDATACAANDVVLNLLWK